MLAVGNGFQKLNQFSHLKLLWEQLGGKKEVANVWRKVICASTLEEHFRTALGTFTESLKFSVKLLGI